MCCHVCSIRTAGGEAAAAHPQALQMTLPTSPALFPTLPCLLQAEKLRLRIHKLQARYATAEEICENFERGHSLRRRCADSVYLLPSAACTQSPCSTRMIGGHARLPAYPSKLAAAETQPSGHHSYQLLGSRLICDHLRFRLFANRKFKELRGNIATALSKAFQRYLRLRNHMGSIEVGAAAQVAAVVVAHCSLQNKTLT